jgi:asparagine synthetase B (glutamine-hydrolysing)
VSTPGEWVVAGSYEQGLEGAPQGLSAASEDYTVFFDGVLYECEGLRRELDVPARSQSELVLAAYERWGEEAPEHLNGTFTIVAWNTAERALHAVRDPLGIQPLFRSDCGNTAIFSNSLEALVADERVPATVSPIALAARIARRMPFQEETFYAAVKRVPQGHGWRRDSNGTQLRRYWDPRGEEPDSDADPVVPEELDAVLEQAVTRRLSGGPMGIYLSGGADSVAVAAYGAELERRHGRTPLALSLVIPGEETVDGEKQRAVAESLGLEQVLLPLEPQIGGEPILDAALELAGEWPAPPLNPWLPGFLRLNREAVERGHSTILTGNGGDEWLTSPYVAADLIRALRLRRFASYAGAFRHSYGLSSRAVARALLWRFGLRPLLVDVAKLPLERHASPLLRLRLARLLPRWLAPDRALRGELFDRPTTNATPSGTFASRATSKLYDHPLQDADMEEIYEAARRSGVRLVHPFCDLDLLALRYRARSEDLNLDGRPKGIVREAVERRYPGKDLTVEARTIGGNVFVDGVGREGPRLLRTLGGIIALADLGVVEPSVFEQETAAPARRADPHDAARIWDALVLEAWLRTRG